jgi:succinyl-CoA synthetase beta subunit
VLLLEYQGKELFKKYGIPIPRSILCKSAKEAKSAFEKLSHPVVIKAQVLAGGRGKAGGIATVSASEQVAGEVERIMALQIGGETPRSLLLEEACPHTGEMYLSVTLDRGRRTFVAISSKAGGIEVESLEGRVVEPIHVDGLTTEAAAHVAAKLSLKGRTRDDFQKMLINLERLARAEECELAEINPVAVKEKGELLALDSKVILDDNALFRHPEFSKLEPEDPLEGEAAKEGFAFVRLDGDIALVGNGAGLVLSTLDLVADAGGKPACFLDLGGGSQRERVEAALRLVRKLPNARRILVNIFVWITRTTDVAEGLRAVLDEGGLQPVYARITGAEEEEAKQVLNDTPVRLYRTAQEAVGAVVEGT